LEPEKRSDIENWRLRAFTAQLLTQLAAVHHSFEALPLVVEAIPSVDQKVKDSIVASAKADQVIFLPQRMQLAKQLIIMKNASADNLSVIAKRISSWVECLRRHVRTILNELHNRPKGLIYSEGGKTMIGEAMKYNTAVTEMRLNRVLCNECDYGCDNDDSL